MTKTKSAHTPGPWMRWGDMLWCDKNPNTSPEWANVVRVSSGAKAGDQICSLARSDQEGEANARLIAAAPDLLEAAELALEEIEFYEANSRAAQQLGPSPSVIRLRAAIAKVGGGR